MSNLAFQQHITGVSDAALAHFIAKFQEKQRNCIVVCRNAVHLQQILEELSFWAPEVPVYTFPAWDVGAFDRMSADTRIASDRLKTLLAIKAGHQGIFLTTVNALSIKIPPLDMLPSKYTLRVGECVNRDALLSHFIHCGYVSVGTVMEPGEFAVRGSIIDFYCPTMDMPIRLDFFDEELESIKTFEPSRQRTEDSLQHVSLTPVASIVLTQKAISTFRSRYREYFPHGQKDALYQDISAGRTHESMGHYLPLFFEKELVNFLELFDSKTQVVCRDMVSLAIDARWREITDSYDARLKQENVPGEEPYRLLKRELLYSSEDELIRALNDKQVICLPDFDTPDMTEKSYMPALSLQLAGEVGHGRVEKAMLLMKKALRDNKQVILSALSVSSLLRMEKMVSESLDVSVTRLNTYLDMPAARGVCIAHISLQWGFETDTFMVLSEQDIFGEKTGRSARQKKT